MQPGDQRRAELSVAAAQDPEPGRLESLPTDDEDADALVAVIRAWGPRPRQLIRFAVAQGWERLRFPRPLMLRGVKLSARWPWSPDARAESALAAETGRNVAGLVSEHLYPMGLIVDELATTPGLDRPRLVIVLSRLTYAVVTVAEHAAVDAAGWAQRIPDPADPWSRYRAAGIDVSTFAPLNLGPRRSTSTTRRSAGPRSTRRVRFLIDGVAQKDGREGLSWVAQHPGKMPVARLREMIRLRTGVTDPDSEAWTMTLPSGHIVTAEVIDA